MDNRKLLVIHGSAHARHAPSLPAHDGSEAVFDQPKRVDAILAHLRGVADSAIEFAAPRAPFALTSLDPPVETPTLRRYVSSIHEERFLHFLQNGYAAWVAERGPDVPCVHILLSLF